MSSGSFMRGDGGLSLPGEVSGEESTIDRSSMFDGTLRTSRNLRVEGQVKGELYCDGTIYIEEGAQVDAKIIASNVTVSGTLTGETTCRNKLQILPSGRVSGRVATAVLVVQEGAIYEGELRMSNVETESAAGDDANRSSAATLQRPTPYRSNSRRNDSREAAVSETETETAVVGGDTKEDR